MLIVEKSAKEKQAFFDQFEQSLDNVYMSIDLNVATAARDHMYPKITMHENPTTMTKEQHMLPKKVKIHNVMHAPVPEKDYSQHPMVKTWEKSYNQIYIDQNKKKIFNYKLQL